MTERLEKPPALPEAERQAAELDAVRRMMTASRGTFSLSIATCNSPALRDYLIEKLRSCDPAIEVVLLPDHTVDVYGAVCESASNAQRSALFVTNLEKSVPSFTGDQPSAQDQPALRSLNATRELWKEKFSCPVVLWLPDYAVTLLATHARDLWSWRSHQFEFVSETATAAAGLEEPLGGHIGLAANLDADQKQFRIAELQQRIAEAGDPPEPQLAAHVSLWLNELGFLFRSLGDLDQAEQMLLKALDINQRLGRLGGTAANYGNLGAIHQTRGDLDRAEQMYRKGLEIYQRLGHLEGMAGGYGNLGAIYQIRGDLDQAEEMHQKARESNQRLGRLEGMAVNYGNLGLIYQTRGDLDRAEQMLLKALDIDQRLGHLEGIASDYGNLGLIYQARGDLDRAEQMHQKSLEINERLGRLEGIASDYGNLGVIYGTRGDLARAEQMLQKSLELDQLLGRLEGTANQYGNLGRIYAMRGDPDKARALWTKARDLYSRIGMPHMIQKVQAWLDELPGE